MLPACSVNCGGSFDRHRANVREILLEPNTFTLAANENLVCIVLLLNVYWRDCLYVRRTAKDDVS